MRRLRQTVTKLFRSTPPSIALFYLFFSILWITFSDRFLRLCTNDPDVLSQLQTVKGWFFVVVTSAFLWLLVRRAVARERRITAAWQQSESNYRLLFETNPHPMWVYDLQTLAFLAVNDAAVTRYGYSKDEFLAMTIADIRPAEDVPRLLSNVAAVDTGLDRAGVWRHRTKGGDELLVEIISHTLTFAGRPAELVLANDVTASEQAQAQLQLRNRALEASGNAILICDAHLDGLPVLYANPALERISGYKVEEILGRHPTCLVGDDVGQKGLIDILGAFQLGTPESAEVRSYRRDGTPFWAEYSVAPVRDGAGQLTHFVTILNDITERKRYEEQLEHQANYDILTGLANRNLLADRLRQGLLYAKRSGRLVAVLVVDLDRFKVINDTLGHSLGDELLVMVGHRLATAVRDSDTAARLSGDVFVLALPDVAEIDDIAPVVRKITDALAPPLSIDGRQLCIGASIGISIYPRDARDAETLIRNADIAMHQAKQAGGGAFRFFSSEMNERMRAALELETDLRRALAENELQLYYQPQVDLATGRICGCEALLRWQHPQRGMVPPGDFIPLAEETGLIVPIGAWVLATVCKRGRIWREIGLPPVSIAVNLSVRQFRQQELVAELDRVLEESGFDPTLLELELTESMLMHEPAEVISTMRLLHERGVRLSLDDFGTGYSSLNYLRHLPVEILKIDRSFVADIACEPNGSAVARSVIAIARSLGLRTVAEGVETPEQLAFLREQHCDMLQGFLFSRPLPEEAFLDLLRHGRTLDQP